MDYPAPKRVIPHFIDCILNQRPLLLSGDGAQRRSFCFVDDMIDGLMAVLKRAASMDGPRKHCFNLGHPEPITIRELARVVVGCALDIGLIEKPLPVVADRFVYSQAFDDRWHRTPDIAHAHQELGFSPSVPLRDGLQRTLTYYHRLQRQAHSHRPKARTRERSDAPRLGSVDAAY